MRISDWSSDVCSSDLGAGSLAALFGHGDECVQQRIGAARRTVYPLLAQSSAEPRTTGTLAGRVEHGGVGHAGPLDDRARGFQGHLGSVPASAAAAGDRKSTRLNSSHSCASRMPSSACKTKKRRRYHSHHIITNKHTTSHLTHS